MHADTESLLLLSLAAPIEPELRDWLDEHLIDCGACALKLDALLDARESEDALPLQAAASAARTWAAPAPPAKLGAIAGVPVYRLPGEPLRLAVGEVAWIGKTLRVLIPGEEPVIAQVDSFRRLATDGAVRLAAAFERGLEPGVEIVEE